MRLRPNCETTVTAEVKVGEDELGSPLYEQRPVFEGAGRFHSPDGQSYVRTASGELKQEQPTVMLSTHGTDPETGDRAVTHNQVSEGAAVSLSPLGGAESWRFDEDATYQVDAVAVKTARGGRPERVELTLQRNPD